MSARGDERSDIGGSGWLVRALTAGFFATLVTALVLITAYWLSSAIGSANPQSPTLLRWFWALAYNVVTAQVQTALPLAVLLHLLAGIGWAVVYALVAEPRLRGPGWLKGAIFALAPWLLSLFVFLPLVGGGVLGLDLGAGPLPIFGNLVLHLVYGATLGQLYLPEIGRSLSERGETVGPGEALALTRASRTMTIGIFLGLAIGGIAGLLFGFLFADIGPLPGLLFGAIIGGVVGALIGSFWGLAPEGQQ